VEHEIGVMDSIGERIEEVGFDALTDHERYYWAIWWLESEANNGSFDQYFRNDSGELAHLALQGLSAVGARHMAALFQAAIDLFPNSEVPTKRERRNRILDDFTRLQEQRLDQLADEFVQDPDDTAELLESFVENNAEQFRGPKTEMERWNARRARGADTRPHGVFEWDLDEEAAKDIKTTDRKCPVCAQPAPDYRKTCKRCGYPYGRAVSSTDDG
jgi:hypothetical protein